jgi:predicted small lipoprotein YifL
VSRFFDRPFLRLTLMAALAASLGLAACGRKGPLDPPPSASLAGEQQTGTSNPLSSPIASPIGGQAKDDNTVMGPNGLPMAKGQKKQIPLDVLLN